MLPVLRSRQRRWRVCGYAWSSAAQNPRAPSSTAKSRSAPCSSTPTAARAHSSRPRPEARSRPRPGYAPGSDRTDPLDATGPSPRSTAWSGATHTRLRIPAPRDFIRYSHAICRSPLSRYATFRQTSSRVFAKVPFAQAFRDISGRMVWSVRVSKDRFNRLI